MRLKVQNGSPGSRESKNSVFEAFQAEFMTKNHDMRDSHIMIYGRIFGRKRSEKLIFGFSGPRRPILHLEPH